MGHGYQCAPRFLVRGRVSRAPGGEGDSHLLAEGYLWNLERPAAVAPRRREGDDIEIVSRLVSIHQTITSAIIRGDPTQRFRCPALRQERDLAPYHCCGKTDKK